MAAAVEIKTGIQYLTDEKGEKTGVLIPIEMWENMEQLFAKEMQRIKNDIVEGMKELEAIEKEEAEEVTLKDFLDEL